MKVPNLSWLALPLTVLLTGCPSSGGGGGVGEGSVATIVYRADQTTDTVSELFLASSGARLNPTIGLPKTVQGFAITPDKSSVVYIADQDSTGVFELYRVTLSNPGVSTKLNGFLTGGGNVQDFKIIPDGSGVVYLADQTTDGINELYRVLFSNPTNSNKLNGTMVNLNGNVVGFDVTADSSRVVYRADQDVDNVFELFQNSLAPIGSATKLHSDYTAGQSVSTFKLLPNSLGVLYIAVQSPSTVNELYQTLFGGVQGQKVNPVLIAGGEVLDFVISPDSNSVVYRADQETNGVNELFRIVLASLPTSTKLNGVLAPNGDVDSHYVVTPDSASVVYIADESVDGQNELYRTVFSGPTRTRLLTGVITGGEAVFDVVTIPDNSGVVYIADQDNVGTREVYRVLFLSLASTRLNPAFAAARQAQEIAVTPDSGSVVYRANQTSAAAVELYRAFFSSAGTSATLNGALVANGNVEAFVVR
jgi:hypothetical protein